MKKILIPVTMTLLSILSFAQDNCVIQNEYDKIFKIQRKKYGESEHLFKTVQQIDSTSCFGNLVNNNTTYIDYLKTHFSDNSNYKTLNAISDSVQLQKEFILSLKNDSVFNQAMNVLTEKITSPENYIPDTVSMNELLNIAVKFFHILKINDKDQYTVKMCTGYNEIRNTERNRNPQIEAFCFSTLINNYQNEEYNLYEEMVKGVKEIYLINMGIDKADRLLRAQGAMYMYMRNSEVLKELIQVEYEKNKAYLPFVLEKK